MRHAEVIALQLDLVAQLRRPLDLSAIPIAQRAAYRAGEGYQTQTALYQRVADALERADAWHVSAELGPLLIEAARSLPGNATLTVATLPASAGYLAYDAPLDLGAMTLGALAWWLRPTRDALVVALLHGHGAGDRREMGMLPLDLPLPQDGSPALPRPIAAGRILLATCLLLEQGVLQSDRQAIQHRATALRLIRERGGKHPLPAVRIIGLARRHRTEPHGERRSVDWSHRWLVRGHWRRQYYPSSGEHRPIYILPHVKGPDDRPLVVRRTVVDVS